MGQTGSPWIPPSPGMESYSPHSLTEHSSRNINQGSKCQPARPWGHNSGNLLRQERFGLSQLLTVWGRQTTDTYPGKSRS